MSTSGKISLTSSCRPSQPSRAVILITVGVAVVGDDESWKLILFVCQPLQLQDDTCFCILCHQSFQQGENKLPTAKSRPKRALELYVPAPTTAAKFLSTDFSCCRKF